MKLRKNLLREHRIYNAYELAKAAGNRVYIDYTPSERGRMAHYAHWTVVGVNFQVNPKSPWYEYGNKHFSIGGREHKEEALLEAIEWAREKFGITAWEKAPFMSYQIKGTIAKIKALIKEVK